MGKKRFYVFRLNDANRIYKNRKKKKIASIASHFGRQQKQKVKKKIKTIYIGSHAFCHLRTAASAKNHLAQQSNCVLRWFMFLFFIYTKGASVNLAADRSMIQSSHWGSTSKPSASLACLLIGICTRKYMYSEAFLIKTVYQNYCNLFQFIMVSWGYTVHLPWVNINKYKIVHYLLLV